MYALLQVIFHVADVFACNCLHIWEKDVVFVVCTLVIITEHVALMHIYIGDYTCRL